MEMTAIGTFEKQDIFYNRMIKDYKNGVIPHSSVFEPYFKWKMGVSVMSLFHPLIKFLRINKQ